VLTVPVKYFASEKTLPVERILVATDFTRQTKKVTDYAFEIKQTLPKSKLYFIHAVKAPNALERVLGQDQVHASLDRSRQWAQNQTRSVTPDELLTEDGGPSTIVKLGRTSDCIVEAAEDVDASLIIMGAKGHGAAQGYFYGTTVNRVLNKVKCPILTLQV
jgi:nucleotide-binding universal stress UspA family protein